MKCTFMLTLFLVAATCNVVLYSASNSTSSLDESESEEENRGGLKRYEAQKFVAAIKLGRSHRDYGYRHIVTSPLPIIITDRHDTKLNEISTAFIYNNCALEALLNLEAQFRGSGTSATDRYDLEDYLDIIDKLRPYASKCRRCMSNSVGCSIS